LFIIAEVRPAPIIEPLESDALPTHAPVIVVDAVELGAVGIDGDVALVHAAAPTVAARSIVVPTRIIALLPLTSPLTEMRECWIGDSIPVAGRPSRTNTETPAARSNPKGVASRLGETGLAENQVRCRTAPGSSSTEGNPAARWGEFGNPVGIGIENGRNLGKLRPR
jgi:hypothetical protein